MTGSAGTSRRRGAHVATALLAVAVVLTGRPTGAWSASSGRVVLLDSSTPSPIVRHCLTRIRQELLAGGFEVSSADPGDRRDPVAIGRAMERQEGAVAVIALLGDLNHAVAELWILDRISSPPQVRRIPAPADDPEHLAEVLAIRTNEVLKASTLGLLLESNDASSPQAAPEPPPSVADASSAPATPTTPARVAAPSITANRESAGLLPSRSPSPSPSPSPSRRFGLEAGISLLESIGGPGPAAVPTIRARGRLGDLLFLRATVAGLGSRPRIEVRAGSASVAQSFALAEVGVALRPGRRWRPVASLGGGALYVQGDGEGISPYRGARDARWAGVLDGGIGILTQLGGTLALTFELHGLLALPHPTLRFYDVEAATLGFPALIASLTVVAWL